MDIDLLLPAPMCYGSHVLHSMLHSCNAALLKNLLCVFLFFYIHCDLDGALLSKAVSGTNQAAGAAQLCLTGVGAKVIFSTPGGIYRCL
ncbi:hypothetical protein FKM82_004225 [Ascaphus truei]